jgi:lipoyl(octanoyl) transferase
MALDYFIANSDHTCLHKFTLRLYKWDRPTLSCGFHQNISRRVNLKICDQLGVEVVRRPTGGRELLHDGDLSFSICGRPMRIEASDKAFFNKTGQVILDGLKAIGLEAELAPSARKKSAFNQGPCLAATSEYEITINGRKIVPMAQRIYRDSILVHGSIPLRASGVSTASLLNIENQGKLQKHLDESAIDIEHLVGDNFRINDMKESLISSFGRHFEGRCERIDLSKSEIDEASKTLNEWKIVLGD